MKYFLLAFAAFAFLAGTAHAEPTNATNCQNGTDLLNTMSNLPTCIVEGFFTYTISGLIASSQELVDSSFRFMFSSPDPAWFCNPYNGIMSVIESLYSLVLMGLALYFILRSGDAEGRANAKRWMENVLVMIVLLAFSFQIFQAMLDLNSYLSTSIANEGMREIFRSPLDFSSAIFALVILIPAIAIMTLTFLTLLIRYLLLPFMLFLFPFAIFLYFIPLTQKWGGVFLTLIVIILFMTTIDALVLLGLSSLFNSPDQNITGGLAHAFAVLFGFAALGIVNALIFILAILSILLQSSMVRGTIGLAVSGKILARAAPKGV